jgi:hypothetical protein
MVRIGGYLLIALLFVGALSAAHTWLWGHHERIGITGMASATGLVAFFLVQHFRGKFGGLAAKPVRDMTPVVSLVGLAAGTWAKTMGTLRSPENGFPIPLGDGSCAWSRVQVTVDGAVIAEMRTADTIELEDGAGNAVEIDVRKADLDLRTQRTFASTSRRPSAIVLESLALRGLA